MHILSPLSMAVLMISAAFCISFMRKGSESSDTLRDSTTDSGEDYPFAASAAAASEVTPQLSIREDTVFLSGIPTVHFFIQLLPKKHNIHNK